MLYIDFTYGIAWVYIHLFYLFYCLIGCKIILKPKREMEQHCKDE